MIERGNWSAGLSPATTKESKMRRLLIAGLAALLVACGGDAPAPPDKKDGAAQASLPETLFVSSAPETYKDIAAIKQTAKEGDKVLFRGRVGGRKAPFVPGRAVMLVSDVVQMRS